MPLELLVLRLLHVVLGAFWIGAGLVSTLFLIPALSNDGRLMGEVMARLERRGYFTALAIVGLVTILTGFRLLWIVSDGLGADYFARATGQVYAAGAVAAVVGFLLAMFVSRPAAARTAQLMPQRASAASDAERARIDEDLTRLRRRGSRASAIAVALIAIATVTMAVARYV